MDRADSGALRDLAAIRRGQGRLDEAARLMALAVRARPEDQSNRLGLAMILAEAGRWAEAADEMAVVAEAAPTDAGLWSDLGLMLVRAGRPAEAVASLTRSLDLDPNQPEAENTLSAALCALGEDRGGAEAARRALSLRPGFGSAENNLGNALRQGGRLEEAIAAYRRAVDLDPESALATSNLGSALKEAGLGGQGLAWQRQAARLAPNDPDTTWNLANALLDQGHRDEALTTYAAMAALSPDDPRPDWAMVFARLPILYEGEDEIAARREEYDQALAGLEQRLTLADAPTLARAAEAVGCHRPFYLSYQGLDDRELQERYGRLASGIMAARHPAWAKRPAMPERDAGGVIRVGVVSAYFQAHSNWKIPMRGWIEDRDRSRFAIYGYHLGQASDAVTRRAAAACHRFRDNLFSVERAAACIRRDAPHLLVYPEIGMDPAAIALGALRLAPIQAVSWGHPMTSGLPTMDYFLSGRDLEPSGADAYYSERLVRLPNLSFCYEPEKVVDSGLSRADFGLPDHVPVILCAQSLFKYLPRHDHVLASLAKALGRCRLVFLGVRGGGRAESRFLARLERAFAQKGLRSGEFVTLLPFLKPADYTAVNRLSDVFLDSLDWSGCNTVMEAMAAGLPVVSSPGRFMRGRVGASILDRAGLADLVAKDDEGLVHLAARLADDGQARREARERTLEGVARVWRDREAVAGFEAFVTKAVEGFESRGEVAPVALDEAND